MKNTFLEKNEIQIYNIFTNSKLYVCVQLEIKDVFFVSSFNQKTIFYILHYLV